MRLELLTFLGAGLLAQADPASEIGRWIANLGSLGLVGWLVWHTTSTTIPAMVAAFREESERDRVALEAQRREFLQELQAQRREFLQALGLGRREA